MLTSRTRFDGPETQDPGPAVEARKHRYDVDGIHVMLFPRLAHWSLEDELPNEQAPFGRTRCVKVAETRLVVGRRFLSAAEIPNARGHCPARRTLSELLSPAASAAQDRHPQRYHRPAPGASA